MRIENITVKLDNEKKQKILKDAFGESFNREASNINDVLLNLRTYVNTYLKKYDAAWTAFNTSQKIEETVQAQKNIGNKYAYQSWKVNSDSTEAAVNFLQVMLEGKVVLEYLREYLTNTHIKTEFYLRTSENNIISTDSNNLSYSYCLSTYGGSGKNYVSLAYSLDQSIGQAITDLRENGLNTEIANKKYNDKGKKDEIFKTEALKKIENVKKFLVEEKKEYAYVKNFDSKDAEIVQKLIATPSLIPRLGQPHAEYGKEFTTLYQYYRSKMGGGGGVKTTALQSGDVGDTQVKLFSNNRVVNVMRQTMIKGTFIELQKNLQIKDMNKFKEFLYKEFTSRSKKTDTKMDQAFQKESRKGIDEILKHLDVTKFQN